MRGYRKRHRFSKKKKKLHKKRRPTQPPEVIDDFINLMKEIFEQYSWVQIFNCDETFWRVSQGGDYTWAEIGSTDITVRGNDEKDRFTVLCTIDAKGNL